MKKSSYAFFLSFFLFPIIWNFLFSKQAFGVIFGNNIWFSICTFTLASINTVISINVAAQLQEAGQKSISENKILLLIFNSINEYRTFFIILCSIIFGGIVLIIEDIVWLLLSGGVPIWFKMELQFVGVPGTFSTLFTFLIVDYFFKEK
jgi:hypothetical protein